MRPQLARRDGTEGPSRGLKEARVENVDGLSRMSQCLRAPLETLSITCCQLTEWDLVCLSQGPSVTQLKELDLSGVRLSSVRLKPLQVLLDAVAATLQTLNLEHCDLLDTHLEAILPALSRCHQLRAFRVGGNSFSTAMVWQLLQYNPKLDHLSLGMSPFPVANYHCQGITYRGRIAQAHARIIWLSNGSCLHWDRISDGSGPLMCPWELPD
ncbi:PRAME family member 20-like [Suricata suricatta]|uniref:PRAME family member 20-like n=1 Tax=Suricata suricatta TaxID=37032 RepID=UPI00115580B4|nr:PRAME family member 20-like [Suricata suricatta]